jgi:hypothetical protein
VKKLYVTVNNGRLEKIAIGIAIGIGIEKNDPPFRINEPFFIPQGDKFRKSRQGAQLSFNRIMKIHWIDRLIIRERVRDRPFGD